MKKTSFKYFLGVLVLASVASCKKDNYSAPSSYLTGHLLYNSDTIQVERDQVPYQIYQYGFGKVAPISHTFTQDGSFSEVLYNGDYKIIIPNGQGPFIWKQTAGGNPDTVNVSLKGNQSVDLQVTPYYMIRNASITISGGTATATCKVEKIITDANARDVERVSLYVNKTQFASNSDNIVKQDLAAADIADMNNVSLSVAVPAITNPTQNYVYARIGVKIDGLEDMIFSQLVKISF
ncbi:MAG TPA: DUF3823 domain-containing protein [Puia sp.]|nr:DUF3823 domain-containing protein [Puia sp.]